MLIAQLSQVYSYEYYDLNNAEKLFDDFVRDHSKWYKDVQEKEMRFDIFKENLKRVNEKNTNSKSGAEFGIARYSDLTPEEFAHQYTGLKETAGKNVFCVTIKTDKDIPNANAPASFDWRRKKIVTEVKDQQFCGSCWAFSAVGHLEGQYALKHNQLVEFSEQQLVDCDRTSGGCNGGTMAKAFRYIMKAGGEETEADYPYEADDGKCRLNKNKIMAKVASCVSYNLTTANAVKQLLYTTGPISIALKADDIMGYTKGIISAASCQGKAIDHGVLLVGYGTEKGQDYWIVKNSWGKDFGEKGYFRMERREGVNTCTYLNTYMATAEVV